MKFEILFTVLFCSFVLTLPADEFKVLSIEKDVTDLSAQRFSVRDPNDQFCAIVKVLTDLDNLLFSSNLGIEKVDYKFPGEIWVYIPPGEKRLKFMKEGFIPLDYDIPLKIETASVYKLRITSVTPQKIEPLKTGFLLVETVPPGAELIINNKSTGEKTPCQVELNEGNYSWELRREQYYPSFGSCQIARNTKTQVNDSLKPKFAGIYLISTPEPGASIKIDNKLYPEKTPALIEGLLPGKHAISLTKINYQPKNIQIDLMEGELKTIEAKLDLLKGMLSVFSSPTGAEVKLNGNKYGLTPLLIDSLDISKYFVEVNLKNYIPFNTIVQISKDTVKSVEAVLKNTSEVIINSNPQGAKVSINGKFKGYTPLQLELPLGKAKIKFEQDGYKNIDQTVEINALNHEFNQPLQSKKGNPKDVENEKTGKLFTAFMLGYQYRLAKTYDDTLLTLNKIGSGSRIYGELYFDRVGVGYGYSELAFDKEDDLKAEIKTHSGYMMVLLGKISVKKELLTPFLRVSYDFNTLTYKNSDALSEPVVTTNESFSPAAGIKGVLGKFSLDFTVSYLVRYQTFSYDVGIGFCF